MHTLLIDDHTLFRQGLKFLLTDLDESITFVEANSCTQALNLDNLGKVELTLLDLNLPGETGLAPITKVRDRINAPIVIISSEESPQVIKDAIGEGASGFIPKSSSQEVLIAALQLILAGGTYLPPNILHKLPHIDVANDLGNKLQQNIIESLSKRQTETLLKVIQGKPNKVIASEMNVSEGTVKAHLSASFRTLGVHNRTEAVIAAAKLGLTS